MFVHYFFVLACSMALTIGASLQQVTNFGENPSNINMYIYVPDNVASDPAVIVAASQWQNTEFYICTENN